ncbi:hypothetical protein [Protofrankia symbiont of Coriaria ruscifolia]|uniref:Uncharacterized protein n=1 Tax=Candidatus Protofrankia californiensis TaxID=1839754 RepID=A0A1C3NX41_9ACTN|nr:hypothetical protein [Protofrankia symbiont of Coriaria ruscifolia]SBW21857.1 hypothetical protein FDG2_2149 [Candidatus Protofrankia californiensis]
MSTVIFGALLPQIVATTSEERTALTAELKRALRGYLADYDQPAT